jgi:hypothetical protein
MEKYGKIITKLTQSFPASGYDNYRYAIGKHLKAEGISAAWN